MRFPPTLENSRASVPFEGHSFVVDYRFNDSRLGIFWISSDEKIIIEWMSAPTYLEFVDGKNNAWVLGSRKVEKTKCVSASNPDITLIKVDTIVSTSKYSSSSGDIETEKFESSKSNQGNADNKNTTHPTSSLFLK